MKISYILFSLIVGLFDISKQEDIQLEDLPSESVTVDIYKQKNIQIEDLPSESVTVDISKEKNIQLEDLTSESGAVVTGLSDIYKQKNIQLEHSTVHSVIDTNTTTDLNDVFCGLWTSTCPLINGSCRNNIPDINETYQILDNWITDYQPLITKEIIGTTFEGASVYLYTITNTTYTIQKNILLITSLLHGNEGQGLTVLLYFIGQILTRHQESYYDYILKTRLIYIIPIINVDAYQKNSLDSSSDWKKNTNGSTTCPENLHDGIDLNRNFGPENFWKNTQNGDKCNDTYPGSHPFSEEETILLQNLITTYTSDIVIWLDLHTLNDSFIIPETYKNNDGTGEFNLDNQIFIDDYKNIYYELGSYYTIFGTSSEILNKRSFGNGSDWAYNEKNIIAARLQIGKNNNWGLNIIETKKNAILYFPGLLHAIGKVGCQFIINSTDYINSGLQECIGNIGQWHNLLTPESVIISPIHLAARASLSKTVDFTKICFLENNTNHCVCDFHIFNVTLLVGSSFDKRKEMIEGSWKGENDVFCKILIVSSSSTSTTTTTTASTTDTTEAPQIQALMSQSRAAPPRAQNAMPQDQTEMPQSQSEMPQAKLVLMLPESANKRINSAVKYRVFGDDHAKNQEKNNCKKIINFPGVCLDWWIFIVAPIVTWCLCFQLFYFARRSTPIKGATIKEARRNKNLKGRNIPQLRETKHLKSRPKRKKKVYHSTPVYQSPKPLISETPSEPPIKIDKELSLKMISLHITKVYNEIKKAKIGNEIKMDYISQLPGQTISRPFEVVQPERNDENPPSPKIHDAKIKDAPVNLDDPSIPKIHHAKIKGAPVNIDDPSPKIHHAKIKGAPVNLDDPSPKIHHAKIKGAPVNLDGLQSPRRMYRTNEEKKK